MAAVLKPAATKLLVVVKPRLPLAVAQLPLLAVAKVLPPSSPLLLEALPLRPLPKLRPQPPEWVEVKRKAEPPIEARLFCLPGMFCFLEMEVLCGPW